MTIIILICFIIIAVVVVVVYIKFSNCFHLNIISKLLFALFLYIILNVSGIITTTSLSVKLFVILFIVWGFFIVFYYFFALSLPLLL